MDSTDRSLLPVDDFDDDTVGVPFEKTPVGGPGRGPFDCLVCQICLLQEPNPKALKNHYLGHYREQVMSKVASNGLAQCPFCTNILHNMAEAVTHVTSAHLSKVLIPLMEGDGLWTGHSIVHSQDAFKLHRLDIKLGRVKMPIENSRGYYELPSDDTSTSSFASSIPASVETTTQPDQHEPLPQEETVRSSPLGITDTQARPSVPETSSDDPSVKEQVVIKDEKREVEEEEEQDIRE